MRIGVRQIAARRFVSASSAFSAVAFERNKKRRLRERRVFEVESISKSC
jgi:hypothetical protein